MRSIELTEFDRTMYAQEIRPYLPDVLFDAHTHLIANHLHPRIEETMPLACDPLLGDVDCAYMKAWWKALFPDAKVAGMLMGFPTVDVMMAEENAYVAEQAKAEGYPFALLTHPTTSAEALEAEIKLHGPTVLKPYMVFSQRPDVNMSSITELIPEHQLDLANTYGLAVMLHVAKPRGMADPDNLEEIARLIKQFPKAQFILAHCGRCFIPPNMETTLDHLPVADNLWLDTSAVCDMGVFQELFNRYDTSRVVFGTDLVTAAAFRGSYVRLGMSWHVCTSEMVARQGGMADQTTFATYENMAALCRAMRLSGCSDEVRETIFSRNAYKLYNYGGE